DWLLSVDRAAMGPRVILHPIDLLPKHWEEEPFALAHDRPGPFRFRPTDLGRSERFVRLPDAVTNPDLGDERRALVEPAQVTALRLGRPSLDQPVDLRLADDTPVGALEGPLDLGAPTPGVPRHDLLEPAAGLADSEDDLPEVVVSVEHPELVVPRARPQPEIRPRASPMDVHLEDAAVSRLDRPLEDLQPKPHPVERTHHLRRHGVLLVWMRIERGLGALIAPQVAGACGRLGERPDREHDRRSIPHGHARRQEEPKPHLGG